MQTLSFSSQRGFLPSHVFPKEKNISRSSFCNLRPVTPALFSLPKRRYQVGEDPDCRQDNSTVLSAIISQSSLLVLDIVEIMFYNGFVMRNTYE